MTVAFVTVTQRVFDRHHFESPLDEIKMAPVTSVKRKRVEVESSELLLPLSTTA